MEPHDESEYMYMMQAEAYKHAVWHAESEKGYADAEYSSSYNNQVIEELANLESGMESVKRNIDYYQNIYDQIQNQHHQLKAMTAPNYGFKKVKVPVGYETYMSDLTTPYVLLEKAIVEAYRKGGHYSAEEFIIMCNPDTFKEIAQEVMTTSFGSTMIHMDTDAKIFYKGMRVFRTYELPPNQFIIR
jgi:hypothetical protein